MRAVILSGNCGPLCSSPTTTGKAADGFNILISGSLSGREKSYCLMSVTKNVCISTTLLVEEKRRSALVRFGFTVKPDLGTHTNRHPMQPLGLPEKVALYQTSIHRTGNGCPSISRTGCRKLPKASQAFRSCLAIALVGTRRHLVPTILYSCKAVTPVSTPGMWSERTGVQVISDYGHGHICPRGNG